ncbi:MAG: MBL fold metallo-hydrolase [Candidatus Omnitrophota bacterium]
MIEVCSLSSGSNGNSFFIRTGTDCFLVDAGISCKQTCLRLNQIGRHLHDIKGIFITHEHSDHIQGLKILLSKHPIPIYITEKTYNRSAVIIDKKNLCFIEPKDTITIGHTVIRSFPKSHDAIDPTLFCFHYKGKKISIVTDAGYPCANVLSAIKDAHILFLETNYDDEMLMNGSYPPFLKRRIAGRRGHLSNTMAARMIADHASPDLTYVFLSHLSENNNSPDIAMQTFQSVVKERQDLQHLQTQTILTSRHAISSVVKMEIHDCL